MSLLLFASVSDAQVLADGGVDAAVLDSEAGAASSANNPTPTVPDVVSADAAQTPSEGDNDAVLAPTRIGSRRTETATPASGNNIPTAAGAIDVDAPTRNPAGRVNRVLEEVLQGTRVGRSGLRFSLNLFGQTGIYAGQGELSNPTTPMFNFSAPQFALLAGMRLFDEFFALTELVFETGPDNESFVDPERLELRWRRGRHFVGLGRTHTELGYWNTAFHHGAVLQPTIERPIGTRFEDLGGIIPNHAVGLVAGTGFDVAGGGVNFMLGVANGRGNTADELLIFTDTNLFKSITLKIDFDQLGGLPFRFGVSGSWDRIAGANAQLRSRLPDTEIDELFANAYAIYRGPRLTLMTEGYLGVHMPVRAGAPVFMNWSAYVLGGYRFGIFTPYVVFDVLLEALDDPYFAPDAMTPTRGTVVDPFVGLRIDIGDWSALKFEYHAQYQSSVGPTVLHSGAVFWGFGI